MYGSDPVVNRYLREQCTDRTALARQLKEIPINSRESTRYGRVPSHPHLLKEGQGSAGAQTARFAASLRERRGETYKERSEKRWTSDPKVAQGKDPLVTLLQRQLQKRGFYDNYDQALRRHHAYIEPEAEQLQIAANRQFETRTEDRTKTIAATNFLLAKQQLLEEEKIARSSIQHRALQKIRRLIASVTTSAIEELVHQEALARRELVEIMRQDMHDITDDFITILASLRERQRAAADAARRRQLEREAFEAMLQDMDNVKSQLVDREESMRRRNESEEANERTMIMGLVPRSLQNAKDAEAARLANEAALAADKEARAAAEAAEQDRIAFGREEESDRDVIICEEATACGVLLDSMRVQGKAILEEEARANQRAAAQAAEAAAKAKAIEDEIQATIAAEKRNRGDVAIQGQSGLERLFSNFEKQKPAPPQESPELKQLREKALLSNRPFLGISLAEKHDAKDQPLFLVVDAIYRDAPIFQAGVMIGDRILTVMGVPVKTLAEMRGAVVKSAVMGKPLRMLVQTPSASDDEDDDPEPREIEFTVLTSDKAYAALDDLFFDTTTHERLTKNPSSPS